MIYAKICTPTFYSTDANELNYYVTLDTDRIYTGKAVKMPGESTMDININEICANYLSNDFSDFRGVGELDEDNPLACRVFRLFNDTTSEMLEEYTFLYSWDDEWIWDEDTTMSLSDIVNGHVDARMYTVRSFVNEAPEVHNVSDYGSVVNACGDYAMYYVGARGGWNYFLLEGNCKESRALTSYNYSKSYRNNFQFENTKYGVDIEPSWELNSGWVTDEQYANLAKNLITSTCVYLHDLKADRIIPVVIDMGSIDILTRKTNEHKPINLNFKVKASQKNWRQ